MNKLVNLMVMLPGGRRLQFVLVMIAMTLALPALSKTTTNSQDNSGAMVVGTWTGTSICVGNRPACKNEVVVYRIVAVVDHSELFDLLADKIIDGKREAMGKLRFKFDVKTRSLESEFTRGTTHGLWSFKVSGDSMTGTLVILPEKSLGRRVDVHRVSEDKVPKPPPPEDYEG